MALLPPPPRGSTTVARFPERQTLWSLCWVVFHALILKLPIQTSLSVAPKLPVPLSSHEKCLNFREGGTPQDYWIKNEVKIDKPQANGLT